ncbi:beta strand repeat-containing protein [Ruegeria arenilitoris]|uniref:beta strand repeat-containing protein n=1 Tax=Ruegeria arenilitoris TaxID=1173585 RepID=UPI00148116F5|nr:autotransporter outer membrane beta-barrel domain-containing protein [Ruegeria arenilitoris]
MQVEQRVHAFARGGRLTKWKGKVASIAPSLFLCSASVLAVSAGSSLAEVVNGARTTPLISSVDEDHTISNTGSISINRLPGPALVQVNVADYSSTVTNAGQLTAPEANVRTRAAVDINGDLSGAVLNSGSITMGASSGDSAVIFGVDVSGNTTGSVQNTGVISIANSALTSGTSVGILVNQLDGTLFNSGTIDLRGNNSSRAIAIGLTADVVNGAASNSGSIGIDVSSSGGSAFGFGMSFVTINGTVDNSGPISASASGTNIGRAAGVEIDRLSGEFNSTGAINVLAAGGNQATGGAIEINSLSGRLQNSGALTVEMTAGNTGRADYDVVKVSGLSGTLTNSGMVSGRGFGGNAVADGFDIGGVGDGANFDNSGTVNIQALATSTTANADGFDFGNVAGNVSNSAPVNVIAGGISQAQARGIAASNVSGTLLNSGAIFADARASNGAGFARGIQVNDVSGQLTNTGAIVASGVGLSAGGPVGVSNNGGATGISTGTILGGLTNNGDITATGRGRRASVYGIDAGNVDNALVNTGAITLTANATGSGSATGIHTGRLNGTLQNSGSIAIQLSAADHASAYGIDVGEIYGALSNSGSITIQVDNGSSIEAIGIRSSTVQGTFSNSGNITVASHGSTGSAEGLRAGSIAATGTMTNTGTITAIAEGQGSGAGAEGIRILGRVAGTLENSGQIIAQAVDTSSATATGILTGAVDGSITNSGTVTAAAGGGSFAYVEGIEVRGNVDGSFNNSGAITAQAVGTSSAYVDGINVIDVSGTFSNSGVVSVSAQAAFAGAEGLSLDDIQGSVDNSGDISAIASGTGTARASGINLGAIDGRFSNSGSIVASAATASSGAPFPFQRAVATGIYVDNINEDPMGGSGVFENSGAIAASASGLNASALGLRFSHVGGKLSNSGNISVSVVADQGSTAFAAGITGANVRDSGDVLNSGTLQVSAAGQNVSTVAAVGMSFDQIGKTVSNAGAISVSAQGDTLVRAHGITTAALSTGGVLSHSGSISVSASGGTDTEAYGIFVGSAQGTVNVTGDVSAASSGKSYAVFLGDGGGTLNVESTADIDGTIRVSDHDVNLSNVGGRVVYRFQDDDTANGVFTTSVSSASQGWFVDNEGGAAPVYASFDATELQPNTNQTFEIAGLSYNLARQLDRADVGTASRDRVVLSTRGSGPIEGFRPYFLVSGSKSDGTAGGSSSALSSNLWSVSAGVTRDLGTGLRYGFGASYFKNDGTFGTSSFDTSGVFISGIVAQNFGFADLSFGLGYGDLDNDETHSSGNVTSEADYSSDMITALVAAERDLALKNGAILTPRASFLYGEQNLDGYTETGGTANATVGDRTVTFNETRIGGAYATSMLGGRLSASLDAVRRDADAPSVVDVTIFGNTLALASGGGGTDTFGEVGLNFEKPFHHGGILHLEARSTLGADVSTQALWASYEWKF